MRRSPADRISPPLALPADHIPPQFSQTNFITHTKEQVDNMPAIRRAFNRTYQPPTKPYEAPPMNIFAIQAAILDDIQCLTNFTETYEEQPNGSLDTPTHNPATRPL
jgi:hypothetical protein